MSTLSRGFTLPGLVYVALFAVIGLALGNMDQLLTPKLIGAAPVHTLVAESARSTFPAITTVEATTGGWEVQLDNGTALFIEARQVSTRGKAPAVAKLQVFDDQMCMLGTCAGYATLIDADGQEYAGYRR